MTSRNCAIDFQLLESAESDYSGVMATRNRHQPRLRIVDPLSKQDREIFQRVFEIDDVTSLVGMIDRPPDTSEVPVIEYAYSMRPVGGRRAGHAPNLTCVFGHPQRHWDGFIVKWRSGSRARLGPDCGEEHFGFKFDAELKRFEAESSRQRELQKFLRLRELLPGVVAELKLLHRDPAVLAYDSHRLAFRNDFSDLLSGLSQVLRRGDLLSTSRRVRDLGAEEARLTKSEEGRKLLAQVEAARKERPGVVKAANHRVKRWLAAQAPVFRIEEIIVGRLSGLDFLTNVRPLEHSVSVAVGTLTDLTSEIMTNRSDHWSRLHPFSKTFAEIRSAIGLVEQIEFRLSEARRFSSQTNLQRVARWSQLELATKSPRIRDEVEARGRQLFCPETEIAWSFPAEVKLRPLDRLVDLNNVFGQ